MRPKAELASDDDSHPTPDEGEGASRGVLRRGTTRSVDKLRQSLHEEVDRIVAATYEVISRTGSIDPPIHDILVQAGLSTPAFYRHFRSKDELLVGLLEDGCAKLAAQLRREMDQASTARGELASWITGMLAQTRDDAAARRARPFAVNRFRIAASFPNEHAAAQEMLVEPLVPTMRRMAGGSEPAMAAHTVYLIVKRVQHRHLVAHSSPTDADLEALIENIAVTLE